VPTIVECGVPFDFELSEPNVGARWQLRDGQRDIELLDSTLVPAVSDALGAPASRRFRLRARAVGSQQIVFELRRLRDPAPLQVHVLDVDVRQRQS
jgi:predicted secreted protein